MPDFTTALGRLLCDGTLRDQFRRAPALALAPLQLNAADAQVLLELSPDDLEYQALILLRKRFKTIQRLMPATCLQLGCESWTHFHNYARHNWPQIAPADWSDACSFSEYLHNSRLLPSVPSEWNILRFVIGSHRFAIHLVNGRDLAQKHGPRLQILFRRKNQWRQIFLCVGL